MLLNNYLNQIEEELRGKWFNGIHMISQRKYLEKEEVSCIIFSEVTTGFERTK